MKLLFDENLSEKLVKYLADLFPSSKHIKNCGLTRAPDDLIWSFAKHNDFILVSRDADFRHRSALFGHPPKFIFLRNGNSASRFVAQLIRTHFELVRVFEADSAASILILS